MEISLLCFEWLPWSGLAGAASARAAWRWKGHAVCKSNNARAPAWQLDGEGDADAEFAVCFDGPALCLDEQLDVCQAHAGPLVGLGKTLTGLVEAGEESRRLHRHDADAAVRDVEPDPIVARKTHAHRDRSAPCRCSETAETAPSGAASSRRAPPGVALEASYSELRSEPDAPSAD